MAQASAEPRALRRRVAVELGRFALAIVAALLIALASWELVGEPSAQRNERLTLSLAERNERQTIVLAQRAEARASIAAFALERPGETEARQRALSLYREGRRLADTGEYAEATERFAAAFAILEEACPDCPSVMLRQ